MNTYYMILKLLPLLLVTGCACKGVTGVVYNQHGVVRHVFPFTPAAEAGLQVGDVISKPKELKGKPGTMHTIVFTRDGIRQEKTVKRVCVDDIETKW